MRPEKKYSLALSYDQWELISYLVTYAIREVVAGSGDPKGLGHLLGICETIRERFDFPVLNSSRPLKNPDVQPTKES